MNNPLTTAPSETHPEATQPEALREPPYSMEAEQAFLGELLRDNSGWVDLSNLVSESDFFFSEHQHIFRTIAQLADRERPFDVLTVKDQLIQAGLEDAFEDLEYIQELARHNSSSVNARSYAETIREMAKRREIISTCIDIQDHALNPEGLSASELVEEAERKILLVGGDRPKEGGPVRLKELLVKSREKIEARAKGQVDGLRTGFADLDKVLDTLRPTDLVIVAGRPSMGKTTFAMNLVEHAVLNSEKVVVVYSLEMPANTLINRMIASVGGIDLTKVSTGRLEDQDWGRLVKAAELLNQPNRFFIDDTAGMSPSAMRAETRRILKAHGPIGLIMVDYLQLMRVPGASGKNRTNEISEISRSLKALAKEFDCPVVALSQLNRSLEARPDKRPLNSDLRESGAIEQDADVIMFVYRDEVYYPESRFKGTAEIIIGKQREGPTGFCRLAFVGHLSRFENLAPGSHQFTELEMGRKPPPVSPRVGRVHVPEVATVDLVKKPRRRPRVK
ncbi:replicative DNA helicase [Pseudomonas sp. Irchel 3E13]|uniref:replicative DNA helicase n=1 Tax=Pseudomonas sp. Irchel 3E13 TaxID=2008975 RepID=UPI0021147E9B|nr:replicative DNA helicase [Pseudomonas sp. Irchel 3E13]